MITFIFYVSVSSSSCKDASTTVPEIKHSSKNEQQPRHPIRRAFSERQSSLDDGVKGKLTTELFKPQSAIFNDTMALRIKNNRQNVGDIFMRNSTATERPRCPPPPPPTTTTLQLHH